MNKDFKYILFMECGSESRSKTKVWVCLNRTGGTTLGRVHWQFSWRQYIFEPEQDTIFSAGCLRDIAEFLDSVKGQAGIQLSPIGSSPNSPTRPMRCMRQRRKSNG